MLAPWQRKKKRNNCGGAPLHTVSWVRNPVRWPGVLQSCSWGSSPSLPCFATEGRGMDPKAAALLAWMLAARLGSGLLCLLLCCLGGSVNLLHTLGVCALIFHLLASFTHTS